MKRALTLGIIGGLIVASSTILVMRTHRQVTATPTPHSPVPTITVSTNQHPLDQPALQSLTRSAWKLAEQGNFTAAARLLTSAQTVSNCSFKVSAGILKPKDLHLISDATKQYMDMGAKAVATTKGPVTKTLVQAIISANGPAAVKGLPRNGFYVVTIAEFC